MQICKQRHDSHLKKLAANTLLVLATFAFLAGCGGDNEQGSNGRQAGGRTGGFAGGSGQQAAAIPVQVAEVTRGDISMYLLQTTTIEPIRQVDILAKVTGQVVRLQTEEGQRVKKGQLLAKLDEAELEIDYMQAKVQMETNKSIYERSKKMLDENLIAEETYETARLQYESSKAATEATKLRLDYTEIRSPINGVVTLRNIELGQRVNVNDALFQIADFNPLRARIYVPEKDMARIFEGQKARITVESEPGKVYTGAVKMISPIVDPASGTAKVTIDINESGKLRPGMFATVYISTDTHLNTLIMPKKALILESEEDQVFIYDDGVARKVRIELGFVSGDSVEVLSGLQQGQRVVTIGQEGLRTGLPIRIPGEDAEMTGTPSDSGRGGPDRQLAARQGQAGMGRGGQPSGERGQGGFDGGDVDPERLKRMEQRFLQNPDVKAAYDKKAEEDPDFKSNPEKKMAFFREQMQKMRASGGGGFRRQQ